MIAEMKISERKKLDYLNDITAEYLGTTPDRLKVRKRNGDLVDARRAVVYIFMGIKAKYTTAKNVADYYNFKAHASALHMARSGQNLYDTDRKFRDLVDYIRRQYEQYYDDGDVRHKIFKNSKKINEESMRKALLGV